MPRRKPQRAKAKAKTKAKKVNGKKSSNGKSNGKGTNGTVRKKGSGAWTPQRRGSPEAWMDKLGYTPAALRCRSLTEMTEAEIAIIELTYGAKVLRPIGGPYNNQRRVGSRSRPVDLVASPDVFSEEVEV